MCTVYARVQAEKMKLSTQTNQSRTGSAAAAARRLYNTWYRYSFSLLLRSQWDDARSSLNYFTYTRTHRTNVNIIVSFSSAHRSSNISFSAQSPRCTRAIIIPRTGSQPARVFCVSILLVLTHYYTINASISHTIYFMYTMCVHAFSLSLCVCLSFSSLRYMIDASIRVECTGTRTVSVTTLFRFFSRHLF